MLKQVKLVEYQIYLRMLEVSIMVEMVETEVDVVK